MAMLLFTGLNGLGVVFLGYVLIQFWKEGHRLKKPGTSNHLIKFSEENRPTVIVVTRPISGGLQGEPAPVSGGLHASPEAFTVKVEPAPVSQSAHSSLSVVSRQSRMSSWQDAQLHRDSQDGINEMPMNRFSTR